MTYEILKGIPAPVLGSHSRRKYPFGKMEIGDSVFIPDWPRNKKGYFTPVGSYGKRYKIKLAGRKMTRDGVEGYMIWRIE